MPQRGTKGTNRFWGLCLLCFFVAGFASCSSPWTGDVLIEPEVEPQPPRVGPVTITVRVIQSGKPVTGAQTKLELNMSHAGMAPVFADAKEIEPGRYQAKVQLTMAGDWSLVVSVNMPDGTKSFRSFDIKGVSSA